MLVEELVRLQLESLRLSDMARALSGVCERVGRIEGSYLDFLAELLETEVNGRYERQVGTKTRLSGLPYHKTMADFDFSFQPSIDKRQIAELLTLRFIESAENVLLLGPPVVGKTPIAVALAAEAIAKGYNVYFVTLPSLVSYLSEGKDEAVNRMRLLLRPKLLIIDEVGYLPLGREEANWLFELVSRRYERGAIILTSNKSYGDWASLFPDIALAAAILDRLLHHSTPINIRGDSYRLKDKRRSGVFQKLDTLTQNPTGEFQIGVFGEK